MGIHFSPVRLFEFFVIVFQPGLVTVLGCVFVIVALWQRHNPPVSATGDEQAIDGMSLPIFLLACCAVVGGLCFVNELPLQRIIPTCPALVTIFSSISVVLASRRQGNGRGTVIAGSIVLAMLSFAALAFSLIWKFVL